MCAPPYKRPDGARARRYRDRAQATPCKPSSLKSAPLGRARAAFATARLGKPPHSLPGFPQTLSPKKKQAKKKIHFSAHFYRCAWHVLRRFFSAALCGWLRPQTSAVYAHVPNGQTPPGHGHEEFYLYAVFASSFAGAACGGAGAPPQVRSSYAS